ncbi:YceI family protein [Pseudoalteromonas xiamenensis]
MLKTILMAGATLASSLFAANAVADWQIDPSNSDVQFVSVKKNTIGEVHHFTQFAGRLSDAGEFSFSIELASVESMIPIRNERMQQMLFEVAAFPKAQLTASLAKQLSGLKAGMNKVDGVEATLSLHGKTQKVMLDLNVAKLGNDLFVTTRKPLLINAKDYALDAGVEALRKVAGLDAIAHAVPVSVSLHLVQK